MPHLIHKSSLKALVAIVIALIICSTMPASDGTQSQVDNRLTAAASRFSFKLYDQILKQRKTKNTFVSPTSIMLALAMTYNGADGTTRQGMARALELEGMSLEEVNRAFADLKSVLAPTDWKIQLRMKVDRPFFFAIRDNQTGVLLFMGSVRNPE